MDKSNKHKCNEWLEQSLNSSTLSEALYIYIEHRKHQRTERQDGEQYSGFLVNYNSFFGVIGGYDASSKISAAEKVIRNEHITPHDMKMLNQGNLGVIVNHFGSGANMIQSNPVC